MPEDDHDGPPPLTQDRQASVTTARRAPGLTVGPDSHGCQRHGPDWGTVHLDRQVAEEDVPDHHLAVLERHKRGGDETIATEPPDEVSLVDPPKAAR